MTKMEKVIKALKQCTNTDEECNRDNCPYFVDNDSYGCELLEMKEDTLELLKEYEALQERHKILVEKSDEMYSMLKEQKPHVLTWDEMIEAGKNHEAVYVEEHENAYQKRFWGIAIEGIEPPEHGYNYPGGTQFNVVDADGDMWDGDLYGLDTTLGWRAWNRKPTEEQMKNTAWK